MLAPCAPLSSVASAPVSCASSTVDALVSELLAKFENLQIQTTTFDNSQRSDLEAEQSKLAVLNAQSKANVMLSGINGKLGKTLEVIEMGAMPIRPQVESKMMRAELDTFANNNATVNISKIVVRARVNVTFEILSSK